MLILSLKILNIWTRKKKAKSIARFDFSSLYITLPHDKYIKKLCNVIYFAFEGGNGAHICSSKNNVAYCGKKTKDNVVFNKSTLKAFLKHLIQSCCFIVGNSFLKQKTRIPTGNNQAQFWANFFLYMYENKFISELASNQKVKEHLFHVTKRFIVDLHTLDDGCVFNDICNASIPLNYN